MNPESMKRLLERDKVFLEELYHSNSGANSKRLLNFASDLKLTTLIQLLHFISNGAIKIKKEHFDEIPRRLVTLLKKNFEKKSAMRTFVNGERQTKLKILFKLSSIYQLLLYPLFNEN